MRISEVAGILGLSSKELIQEVEAMRDQLTDAGHKVAKRLTASSGLEEDSIRLVMAQVDLRRREEKRKVDEVQQAAQREEQEKRRREEEEKRKREEEERHRQAEEARKRADEELERRRQEIARLAALTTEAPTEPPAAKPTPIAPAPAAVERPAVAARKSAAPAADAPARPAARRDEAPRREGDKPKRQLAASKSSVEEFARVGLGPTVTDDYGKTRRGPHDRTKKDKPKEEERPRRKGVAKVGKERHSFRPTQIFNNEVVTRRPVAKVDRPKARRPQHGGRRASAPVRPKIARLVGDFTVGQFAEKLGLEPSEILKKLFMMGELITINQVMNPDLAELLADEVGVEVIITREGDEFDVEEFLQGEIDESRLQPRPPVVTIMGHVDHGKTSLLDTIRKANVVDSEHGGITQHIGAYYVTTEKGDIVFLDTPGHAAFTAMRARGANVTDLVVLVVAANDGVMPQTVEAINHARAAEVPIIVAINKIDVEGANPSRVKTELMRYELVSEDLGGDTIMVEISAKQGTNVKELLEMIALQAEVLELKADPGRPGIGTIVESHVDPNRGAVATVLIEQGTLRVGDVFVCGTEFGRVRAMRDDKDKPLEEAGPARPVEIMGLSGSPGAGEQFLVMPDEAAARDIAERRMTRRKARSAAATPHVTLDNLADRLKEGDVKALNLVIRGDVQGSVEAICSSLMKIKSDKIQLRILHSGVGAVTEGDIQLADASDAIVIGFNVRPDVAARDLAAKTGVQIKSYSIIYELLEEIEAAMRGMLEPVFEEDMMSRIEVREVFRIHKVGNIAGCFVAEGTVARNHKARLVRDGSVVWRGDISSLRRHKDDVKEVQSGLECGIGLQNFNDVKAGDVIETYVLRQLEATLVSTDRQPSASGVR